MYCTGKTTNAQGSHTSNRKQLVHWNLTLQTCNVRNEMCKPTKR